MAHARGTAQTRILRAARQLFFAQGFSAVSTDLLAREASVSKATLYKYFPSMTAVLQRVVEDEASVFEHDLDLQIETRQDFELLLVRFGERLLNFLNSAETIAFAQLMAEEARQQPDIAKVFYEAAYDRTQRNLAVIVELGMQRGFLSSTLTPLELAEQLLGMWEGFRFVRAQLGLTATPFQTPRTRAEQGVQTLLRGAAPHP